MSNMYERDKFHDRQKAVLQKSAQKIENDSGWSQDNFLRGYAEEILPASGAELSFGELCAIGEQVEQEAAFSAKEAMRNKIKARRDAERYKSTGTDSEQRTPNPFEDSSAIATESPKNEDTLNTMRKHADAQPTKSAGIKTSKKQSLVETTRELKKYIGNSGKSVLGSFIRRLYPKESISSIRLKQMKNEFGMSSLANAVINFDILNNFGLAE